VPFKAHLTNHKSHRFRIHLLICEAWHRSSRSNRCAAACGAPLNARARRRRCRHRRCAATQEPRMAKTRSGSCQACPPLATTLFRRGLLRLSLMRRARSSWLARRLCDHVRCRSHPFRTSLLSEGESESGSARVNTINYSQTARRSPSAHAK